MDEFVDNSEKPQVLTFSKLEKLLYGDTTKQRFKSGSSPAAHIPDLLQSRDRYAGTVKAARAVITGETDAPEVLKAIAELQLLGGLRISEVLGIKGINISLSGAVYVEGKKGSHSRIVQVIYNRDFFSKFAGSFCFVFSCYSRYWVYRQYKRYGITHAHLNGIYNSVTHALRHAYIAGAQQAGACNDDIQRSIGHKSKKSTSHYINKNRNGTKE